MTAPRAVSLGAVRELHRLVDVARTVTALTPGEPIDAFAQRLVRVLAELRLAIRSPLGDEMAAADEAGFDRLVGGYDALRAVLFAMPDDASPVLAEARLFALRDFLGGDDDRAPGQVSAAVAMVDRILAAGYAACPAAPRMGCRP